MKCAVYTESSRLIFPRINGPIIYVKGAVLIRVAQKRFHGKFSILSLLLTLCLTCFTGSKISACNSNIIIVCKMYVITGCVESCETSAEKK